MRLTRTIFCASLTALFMTTGCRNNDLIPETPMPPNTILLSQMMRELSAQPGFTEALLKQFDTGGKKGAALMTPTLIDELRKRILGKDWQGLDRFPGWSMREINPTVRVVGHYAGKDEALEDTAAVHPGTPVSAVPNRQYLDLGPYALDKGETVSLDQPSTLPGFTTDGLVTQLGDNITRGDGPNDLAPEHAESQRLADVLNRLAANRLDGVSTFTGVVSGKSATSPEALIERLVESGATVTVNDARYFANFGHLHYKGQDVMMPFFVNSQLLVPHTGGFFRRARPLLIPVSHAEYEWHIRGPKINADISYYFGIDGKSEWRTMDTLDQTWVLKRNAHTYTGGQAIEVTRLAGLLTVAYMHQHARRPGLPFGGYYALGVCQDGVSAIEHALTGKVTLFPNTVDAALFDDPRDSEINNLMAAIPKDRSGTAPDPSRIFGSLPTTNFNIITIPGLARDLNTTYGAWKDGSLSHEHSVLNMILDALMLCVFLPALIYRIYKRQMQRRKDSQPSK
jgi:hypothetical protein